jgi:predicted SAM-dependent methyltransferase
VLTFDLVEPGYVDVNPVCRKMDFGMSMSSFDKEGFDKFALENNDFKLHEDRLGWYMPVIFPKRLFIGLGGYCTYPPFPFPNDIIFFDLLKQQESVKFAQMSSFVYHFQRMSQRTRLNLCCGSDTRDGWVNVDKEQADISSGTVPFKDGEFEYVLFKHALEHFRLEIARSILKEIHRILANGGQIEVRVPDFKLACIDYLGGVNTYPDCALAIERIYGLGTSEEQVHKWGYTKETLRDELTTAGFTNVEFKEGFVDEIYTIATK